MSTNLETAVFGGGCFWCTEAIFTRLKGVESVQSGYAGGHTDNPTYEQVSMGGTGHVEAIKVTFDPNVITFRDLMTVFFATHDPTTLNRQGNDVGTQYRSAIFYHTPEQKRAAEAKIAELTAARLFDAPIVTEVAALERFYKAETYHQGYFQANPAAPYCQYVVSPKVAKFRNQFSIRLKQ